MVTIPVVWSPSFQRRLHSLVPEQGVNLNQFTVRTHVAEFVKLAKPAKNLIVGGRFSFLLTAITKRHSSVAGAWSVISGNISGGEAKQEFLYAH